VSDFLFLLVAVVKQMQNKLEAMCTLWKMQLHADVPPGYGHLHGANLWYVGKNCPGSVRIPNLKSVALSVCEIEGSQVSNFCHLIQAP